MQISATELNKHPGSILNMAIREPVIIQKSGKEFAVLISYERYLELEDAFWGAKAESNEKNAEWLSTEESLSFLKDI